MKGSKSCAVLMFIGMLLIVVFVVGMVVERNPSALQRQYHYDISVDMFGTFCAGIWLPAGIVGIPLFLVTLIISLIREKKNGQ